MDPEPETRGSADPLKLPRGWSVQTLAKATGKHTGSVVVKDALDRIQGIVPVNKNGNIPKNLAIIRLLDIGEGDREGRMRSPFVDLGIQADHVASGAKRTDETDRVAQYLWWLHPNESDYKGVDTPDARWAAPAELREKGFGMAILASTRQQRDAVVEILRQNFTERERRLMRGLLIKIRRPPAANVAGVFQAVEGATEHDEITVDPKFLLRTPDSIGPRAGDPLDQDTLTHELVHFLRYRDPERHGEIDGRPGYWLTGTDRDLEEAMTSIETLARVRQAPDPENAGYYSRLRPINKAHAGVPEDASPEELMIHDKQVVVGLRGQDGRAKHDTKAMKTEVDIARGRIETENSALERVGQLRTFTSVDQRDNAVKRMFRGRSGRPARKVVQNHFPDTALAHLQIYGENEAIDTYWSYRGELEGVGNLKLHTHIYSPDGDLDRRAAIDNIVTGGLTRGNAGVAEWRDGELIPLGTKRGATATHTSSVARHSPFFGLSAGSGPPTQKQLDGRGVRAHTRSSMRRPRRRSRR